MISVSIVSWTIMITIIIIICNTSYIHIMSGAGAIRRGLPRPSNSGRPCEVGLYVHIIHYIPYYIIHYTLYVIY